MSATADQEARDRDVPILAMKLTPHRSLSPRDFRLVMGLLAGAMTVPAVLFLAIGAWPIAGFMGLDIVLVFAAFKLNFRAARAVQRILVTDDRLTVHNVTPSGKHTVAALNPYWARLEITRAPEIGIVAMQIASRGVRLRIGRFLSLPELEPVAAALSAALHKARGGAA